MANKIRKNIRADRRKKGVRFKITGTTDRPRLTVSRSLKNITAQIIDDERMVTLAAVSTLSRGVIEKVAGKNKIDAAGLIGEEIARRALEKNITKVVFDRNRYLYHGRVKSLADAARKAGLKF
ncbi:MAG: 50S ribosomal protein L18 [Candidatus Zixiibacteriota bacterium]|nr:MAG: 50S ribosomal protein L18 [candidate division Zixibacteria bacterium]